MVKSLRDLPAEVLSNEFIGVSSTDRFLANTIDLDHVAFSDAITRMLARWQRPELTRDERLLRF